MTVVFPFDGVAFHEVGCGSAFLSATENVGTQAAQLTSVAYSSSSAPCLLNKRRHLCWCGTEPLQKTRGAFHTHDPRQLIFRKLLFDSISWLGHRLLWTRPLRPWLHICTSHSHVCVLSFLFLKCGQHVSTRRRRISQTCLGFCFSSFLQLCC